MADRDGWRFELHHVGACAHVEVVVAARIRDRHLPRRRAGRASRHSVQPHRDARQARLGGVLAAVAVGVEPGAVTDDVALTEHARRERLGLCRRQPAAGGGEDGQEHEQHREHYPERLRSADKLT